MCKTNVKYQQAVRTRGDYYLSSLHCIKKNKDGDEKCQTSWPLSLLAIVFSHYLTILSKFYSVCVNSLYFNVKFHEKDFLLSFCFSITDL